MIRKETDQMKTGFIIFTLLVLADCECTPKPEPINNSPILKEMVVYPTDMGGLWSFDLIAAAVGQDGDSLI